MKKYLCFAALATLAYSSCTNDESVNVVANELQPVVLGASSGIAKVETRGTGTVGDVEGGNNVFQFEDLYVLMTNVPDSNTPTWGFTNAGGTDDGTILGEQFDNTFICRPELSTNNTSVLNYMDVPGGTNGLQKYYPAGGSSDFFAYYVDDAAKNTDLVKNADNTMTIPFKLDGTQDIMAGKASDQTDGSRGYSAKTARNNTVPVINMKHVLTRLTFEVISGHDNADGLTIQSVGVESQNKGTLLVAYNEAGCKDADQLTEWTNEDPVMFWLKEKPAVWAPSLDAGKPSLVAFTPVVMGKKNDPAGDQNIGEAMFVKPGETEYWMTMNMVQQAKVGTTMKPESQKITRSINLGGTETFKPGYSYHVKITVYGLSDIRIQASVEPWIEGDNIEIDTAL